MPVSKLFPVSGFFSLRSLRFLCSVRQYHVHFDSFLLSTIFFFGWFFCCSCWRYCHGREKERILSLLMILISLLFGSEQTGESYILENSEEHDQSTGNTCLWMIPKKILYRIIYALIYMYTVIRREQLGSIVILVLLHEYTTWNREEDKKADLRKKQWEKQH